MNFKTFLKAVFMLTLVVEFFACNDHSSAAASEDLANGNVDVDYTKLKSQDTAESKLPARPLPQQFSKIVFNDITVSLYGFLVLDDEGKLEQVQPDSTYLFADIGESIEGQVLEIKSREIINVKLEQRYETSVTIMQEGPHCDLLDWEHYYSDWKPLRTTVSGQFIAEEYTDADREKFAPVNMDDLRKKVRSQCGAGWVKPINNITSPTQTPAGVGISRYFLRITGEKKSDHSPVKKIIVIENPMGC